MRDVLARLPIKHKLTLTFLFICMIVVVVGGVFVSQFARTSLEDQIAFRVEAEAEARSMAIGAARDLIGRRAEDFASDGFIRNRLEQIGVDAAPHFREELARHLRTNKLPLVQSAVSASVLDMSGQVVAATAGGPWPAEIPVGESETWTATFFGKFSDRNQLNDFPSFLVCAPIRDLVRSRILGLMVLRIHVGRFLAGVPGIAKRTELVNNHELVIGDPFGNELHLPTWLIREGAENADLVEEAAGFRVVTQAAELDPRGFVFEFDAGEIGGKGWKVRVDVDATAAMAPVRSLENRYFGAALVILAVGFFSILATVRLVVLPLRHLRAAAEKIANGDHSVRVDIEADDEIGVVGTAFNAMAAAVETRTFELERRRDELASVVASMHDGLCLLSPEGEVLLANAAAQPLKKLLAESSPRHGMALCKELHCSDCLRSTSNGASACEVEIDGRVFEVQASDLRAGGVIGGRLLVSRDITERLEMAERQAFHERMSMAGELAAVVAHEINNPLASISMYAQMMSDELPPESAFHEHVDVIERNTAACSRAIRDLLENVRGGASEVVEVDFRDIAQDAARFLAPLAKVSGVTLRPELDDSVEALVVGDETKLRQALMNLAMNGIQATSPGGSVAIKVSVKGEQVIVRIVDEGSGIPDADRERIFEPFFTTKAAGEGTGLGLPTARRTVESHGGQFALEDSSAKGTTFRFSLPLSAATAADLAGSEDKEGTA
ncbi:MAG: ATP-binding protein [Planctomycetota bacterium]